MNHYACMSPDIQGKARNKRGDQIYLHASSKNLSASSSSLHVLIATG